MSVLHNNRKDELINGFFKIQFDSLACSGALSRALSRTVGSARTRQLVVILTVTYKQSSYKVVLSLSFIFLYLRCETDTDRVLSYQLSNMLSLTGNLLHRQPLR